MNNKIVFKIIVKKIHFLYCEVLQVISAKRDTADYNYCSDDYEQYRAMWQTPHVCEDYLLVLQDLSSFQLFH